MKNNSNGFFVVIEGVDGSGKSSITRRLVKILQSTLGKNVKLTFEPHDPSCAGLFIRQILMRKLRDVPHRTLALAFAVNRADHCDREIIPFLNQANGTPRLVVCDRYYLSSLVYQSNGDLSFNDIMDLNSGVLRPDLTIFLNASSSTCYDRMRNRQETKELFERNLNQTKKKYAEAIEYLRSLGGKIIEVQADGTMAAVIDRIIEVLVENSPHWLTVQKYLPVDEEQHIFEFNKNITSESFANKFSHYWNKGPIYNDDRLKTDLSELEEAISQAVRDLSSNDVSSLFIDFISQSGFSVLDRLPWTDLDAFGLQYKMPLGILQRGAVLLLGESQRYSIVISKLLSDPKYMTLKTMSDFLFIFDLNPAHLITDYYEREIVVEFSSLSPSLAVIGRKQIADFILTKALDAFRMEHMYTFQNKKNVDDVFREYYNTKMSSLHLSLTP